MREYEERKARGDLDAPPFPDDVNCDVDGKTLQKGRETLRASDLVIGAAVLAPVVVRMARAMRERVPALSRDRDDLDAA